jgi:hypothetical protein
MYINQKQIWKAYQANEAFSRPCILQTNSMQANQSDYLVLFPFIPGSAFLSIQGASLLNKFLNSGLTTSVTGLLGSIPGGGRLLGRPRIGNFVLTPGLLGDGAGPLPLLTTGLADPSLMAVELGDSATGKDSDSACPDFNNAGVARGFVTAAFGLNGAAIIGAGNFDLLSIFSTVRSNFLKSNSALAKMVSRSMVLLSSLTDSLAWFIMFMSTYCI